MIRRIISSLLTSSFYLIITGCAYHSSDELIPFEPMRTAVESTPDLWIYKHKPIETPFFGRGYDRTREEGVGGVYFFREGNNSVQGIITFYTYINDDNENKVIYGKFPIYQCDNNSSNISGEKTNMYSTSGFIDGEIITIESKCLFIKRRDLGITD